MTRILAYAAILLSAALVRADVTSDSGISAGLEKLTSGDSAQVQNGINTLRQAGPQGLDRLLKLYDANHDARLLPAIDAVAGQHDAIWSRLYWYTDLDQAKSAAKQQNKPILYLRMLGKLTDEYSCANSRFFRTILYTNTDVSKILREQFVLVWVSERPVPVVTIDFGDGRVLKRTLTGNSIQYILDPQGNVVDALPGVFGPGKFMEIIQQAKEAAVKRQVGQPQYTAYYLQAQKDIRQQLIADAQDTNVRLMNPILAVNPAPNFPNAAQAGMITASKMAVEKPMLAAVVPDFSTQIADSIAGSTDAAGWQKIAAQHSTDSQLDDASIALIRSQNPAKFKDSSELNKTVNQFQDLIALDTVHNNYQFRRQILAWLDASQGEMSLEDLNQRVYSQLFLTPKADPWLGLMPTDAYSALSDDGVCTICSK